MEFYRHEKIVGKEVIKRIREKARSLGGAHILQVNSTYQGGGVAEMLNSIIPLFNEVGLKVGWRVLHGQPDFFMVTKKIHNALQGGSIRFTEQKKKIYYNTNERFSKFTHVEHDLVVVHDPQPLALIDFYKKEQPWIFRCHIDLSNPYKPVYEYLKHFMEKYDSMVISHNSFVRNSLTIPQRVVYPAINPLSPKNEELSSAKVNSFLEKYGIPTGKPIISQISRFDKWKDPIGVIKVFDKVRKKADCSLVLLGNLATDDPEGGALFEKVQKAREKSPHSRDIHLLLVENDTLVNSLQRASSVIIQKSSKEGFGLTVTEALYKKTPVVSSNIGGIPLQISNGVNGFLHEPSDNEGFAQSVIKLLKDEKLRKDMGENGHKKVVSQFLITRLMDDWLDIYKQHLSKNK